MEFTPPGVKFASDFSILKPYLAGRKYEDYFLP